MWNPFGPFVELFRYWGAKWRGRARRRADALLRDPDVIRDEMAGIKRDKYDAYKQALDAVTKKVTSRTNAERRVKDYGDKLAGLAAARSLKIKADPGNIDPIAKLGFQYYQASTAAANARRKTLARAAQLKNSGLAASAAADDELTRHRTACDKYEKQAAELLADIEHMETQLRDDIKSDEATVRRLNSELVGDKANVNRRERELKQLDGETEDMILKVMDAEQAREARVSLAEVDDNGADARLARLRAVRDDAISSAQVDNEMTRTGDVIEDEYLTDGSPSRLDAELEAILSGGNGEEDDDDTVSADRLPTG